MAKPEIVKIVLTGGPCAGKTSALGFIADKLTELGVKVFAVNESASRLLLDGITPEKAGKAQFQRRVFEMNIASENKSVRDAEACGESRAVILFDRGLLDGRAYIGAEEFAEICRSRNLSENKIRNRYDAVFHLVTAADGAKNFYEKTSNPLRRETPCEAAEIDKKLLAAWTGTTHLRIIDNSTDFDGKLNRLLEEIKAVLGIPKPLEIERKFLIEYPDLKLLENMSVCRRVPITQAYLTTPEEGNFRIRRRGEGDDALYIKTVKIKITDIKRIEIESLITEEEFYSYLKMKDSVTGVISKDRYCIAANGTYYELDVYPFWQDRATLEIELLSENQPYKLPDFVKVVADVSRNPEYRNLALAQKYGGEICKYANGGQI